MARKNALYDLQFGDPSLMLDAVRKCLKDSKKPWLFRLFSGHEKEDDIMAAIELAEPVAAAWSKGVFQLADREIYTLLRAHMKALRCMQEQPERARDVEQRARMAGKLLLALLPHVASSKNVDAKHTVLRMKGQMVAFDNSGIRCVDEATVFAFAQEIFRFWDANRGSSNPKLRELAEELDQCLEGDSRAIMRAKRHPADKQ